MLKRVFEIFEVFVIEVLLQLNIVKLNLLAVLYFQNSPTYVTMWMRVNIVKQCEKPLKTFGKRENFYELIKLVDTFFVIENTIIRQNYGKKELCITDNSYHDIKFCK